MHKGKEETISICTNLQGAALAKKVLILRMFFRIDFSFPL